MFHLHRSSDTFRRLLCVEPNERRYSPRRRKPSAAIRRLVLEPLENRSLLAAVITVNSTADTDIRDSQFTLREAIEVSNRTLNVASLTAQEQAQISGAPSDMDTDTIGFHISGAGVHTINISTALPIITDPVIIDGYTQPGASPNTNAVDAADPTKRGLNGTLLIELNGALATSGAGLTITSSGSTVRGLIIGGFPAGGIYLNGGDNNVIAGNYIGVNENGTGSNSNGNAGVRIDSGASGNIIGTNGDGLGDVAERNLISANATAGIAISGSGSEGNVVAGNLIGTSITGMAALANGARGVGVFGGAQRNRIGANGDGLADGSERNLISGNTWDGVGIYDAGTSQNIVAGNYIGTDITGAAALGNIQSGVSIFGAATSNVVGGLSAAQGNIIGGNQQNGVFLGGAGTSLNQVLGNSIGTDATGTIDLGNKLRGVQFNNGASDNAIGGAALGSGNIIAFNVLAGIRINATTPASIGNAILRNAIYSNGSLGIALADDGMTPNDPGDVDTGPNNFQNYPDVGQTMWGGSMLRLNYSVSSTPGNSTYPLRIEFFKADTTSQGQVFLGADTYTESDLAAGIKTLVFTPEAPFSPGDRIVATATDSSPTGTPADTSEFSAAITPAANPWHNFLLPPEVDGDRFVAPKDALSVINYLNAFGSGPVPFDTPAPLYDTNGDTFVSPADALLVINIINSAGSAAGPSGESLAAIDPASADLLYLLQADGILPAPRRRSIGS